MKLIHAYVDNPTKNLMKMSFGVSKTAKSTCYIAKCSNCSNCEVYALGQCIQLNDSVCPYGQTNTELGFTSKAKGFYTWINKMSDMYKPVLNALTKADTQLYRIGDYVYFPYNRKLNLDEVGSKIPTCFKSNMIGVNDFTSINLLLICTLTQSDFSSPWSYREYSELLPILILQISHKFPTLFTQMVENKGFSDMYNNLNVVGKKAYLKTLEPNIGTFNDLHGNPYTWDGTHLIGHTDKCSHIMMDTGKYISYSEVKFTITDDVIVTITDKKQVNAKTTFVG